MKRFASTLLSVDIVVQLLALQHGFAVLTDGTAYRVAPDAAIVDAKRGMPAATPLPGTLVRLTFDNDGVVHTIASDLPSNDRPSVGSAIATFAVPGMARGVPAATSTNAAFAGKRVTVTFTVLVPSTTQPDDTIYLTDSELRWNPVAIRLDRVGLLRFRTVIAVTPGTDFRYLYTRGNGQTIELGRNGMQRKVRTLQLHDLAPQRVDDVVDRWGDEVGNTLLPQPSVRPTPFNPAPYPNLPVLPHHL
jgi:hypothetical protein